MIGTTPAELTQHVQGVEVSLAKIYSAADVDVRIVKNPPSIPRQDTIRLADLHGMMASTTPVQAEQGELTVHMLVVTKDVDEPETLGVMFDFGTGDPGDMPREGFAVFENAHDGLSTVRGNSPQALAREVLLTTAHELSHVFNLHHADWSGTSFDSGSTIEGYSYTDTVKWSLSPASLAHFKGSCPQALVLPGAGGWPFGMVTAAHAGQHQAFPMDQYNVVPDSMSAAARSSTPVALSMATRSSARDVTAASPLQLEIASAKTNYVVGEAIALTVALVNAGDSATEVVPLLNPEYRFLTIAVRGPDQQQFRTYLPPVLRDARGSASRSLAAKDKVVEEAKVFFGSDGWTFEKPGDYFIEATFPAGPKSPDQYIKSKQLKLTVEESRTLAASRAQRILTSQARLGRSQGLYLYMGGGSHLQDAQNSLREVVRVAPESEQAVAARDALTREALGTLQEQGDKVERLKETERLLGTPAAQNRASVSSTGQVETRRDLVRELDEAGLKDLADKQRAVLDRELSRDNAVRELDRRNLVPRL